MRNSCCLDSILMSINLSGISMIMRRFIACPTWISGEFLTKQLNFEANTDLHNDLYNKKSW